MFFLVFFYFSALCREDLAKSDFKLFCPSIWQQNITESSSAFLTTSDNAVYLSFSPLHQVSNTVQMKGCHTVSLDRAIYSTTALRPQPRAKENTKGSSPA